MTECMDNYAWWKRLLSMTPAQRRLIGPTRSNLCVFGEPGMREILFSSHSRQNLCHHATNPASCLLVGYKVSPIQKRKEGRVAGAEEVFLYISYLVYTCWLLHGFMWNTGEYCPEVVIVTRVVRTEGHGPKLVRSESVLLYSFTFGEDIKDFQVVS